MEPLQKNMQIDLHIKSVSLKVTEHSPVCVIWQRGNEVQGLFKDIIKRSKW